MGKRHEEIVQQRGFTDDKKAHENVLRINT